MTKSLVFIFYFISLLNVPTFAAEIIIRKGDTLTKIANTNNTTVREIMDTNNIFDANSLSEGQIIKLPNNIKEYNIHIVKKGESLSQISKQYKVDKSTIIDLNELNQPDKIFIGQKIKIPSTLPVVQEIKEDTNPSQTEKEKNVEEESKDNIVMKKDSSGSLIKDKWKDYGPLKINWSSWTFKDGNFLANSIHSNGKPLFIAVKCSKRILNRTGVNGEWRDWISPKEKFEFNLLNDICNVKENL